MREKGVSSGESKSPSIKSGFTEIFGGLLLISAILIFLALASFQSQINRGQEPLAEYNLIGSLGHYSAELLFLMFGKSAFLLGPYFLLLGLLTIVRGGFSDPLARLTAVLIMIVGSSILGAVLYAKETAPSQVVGGLIGARMGGLLQNLLGRYGSAIFSAGVLMCGIFLAIRMPMSLFLLHFQAFLQRFLRRYKEIFSGEDYPLPSTSSGSVPKTGSPSVSAASSPPDPPVPPAPPAPPWIERVEKVEKVKVNANGNGNIEETEKKAKQEPALQREKEPDLEQVEASERRGFQNPKAFQVSQRTRDIQAMLSQMQRRQGLGSGELQQERKAEEKGTAEHRYYFDGYFDPDGSRFHFRRASGLGSYSYLSSQTSSHTLSLEEGSLHDLRSHNVHTLESSPNLESLQIREQEEKPVPLHTSKKYEGPANPTANPTHPHKRSLLENEKRESQGFSPNLEPENSRALTLEEAEAPSHIEKYPENESKRSHTIQKQNLERLADKGKAEGDQIEYEDGIEEDRVKETGKREEGLKDIEESSGEESGVDYEIQREEVENLDTNVEEESYEPVQEEEVLPPSLVPKISHSYDDYRLGLDFLQKPKGIPQSNIAAEINDTRTALKKVMREYGIQAEVVDTQRGPIITLYEIKLEPGIKVSRVIALQSEICMNLAVPIVRIIAPIPGKATIGIEIPNRVREPVLFSQLLPVPHSNLSIILGKNIAGENQYAELTQLPHLLIAGATGAGKSVYLNAVIASLLYQASPKNIRFVMIDPKMVELKFYEGIPHLLMPVITDVYEAGKALRWLIDEMERRYCILSALRCRDIRAYNQRVKKAEQRPKDSAMPYIVVLIDELSDLMMIAAKDVEDSIIRLTQKARAVGIHIIMATQRPSVDVITALIKANCPARVAFQVAQRTDSRTILDASGAENLLGKGDLLYKSPNSTVLRRIQAPLLSAEEVEAIVKQAQSFAKTDYIDLGLAKSKNSGALNNEEELDEEVFTQALDIVLESGKTSTSYLQRRMRIGYNRAANLIEVMEERGYLSPIVGNKSREILKRD